MDIIILEISINRPETLSKQKVFSALDSKFNASIFMRNKRVESTINWVPNDVSNKLSTAFMGPISR